MESVGAADEAVMNKIQQKHPKSPLFSFSLATYDTVPAYTKQLLNTAPTIPTSVKMVFIFSVGYNDTGGSSFSLPAAGLPGRPTGRSCLRNGHRGKTRKMSERIISIS